MSLFDAPEEANRHQAQPLAARMRPRSLAEFVGQQHFLGEGKLLRRLLAADRLGSVIFYGPPGTGKTTLARLLAQESRSQFQQLSAVASGVKELREVLAAAADRLAADGRRTLLVHRRDPPLQQGPAGRALARCGGGRGDPGGRHHGESFLHHQQRRWSAAAGSSSSSRSPATTSRRCCTGRRPTPSAGWAAARSSSHDDALDFLAETSDGDARRALSALEVGVLSSHGSPVEFTRQLAEESVQRKAVQYDRQGDAHYDAISALIKSIRGSDPDAALYWLARMLEGGEDVRFLARRLVILASEDVGNAEPAALRLAVAAAQACELVGLPECQLTLAQAVTYLACAPKSNAATVGIFEARHDVREGRLLPVPVHLRDSHYGGAKRLGHGQGYQYAHDAPDAIAAQDYLGVEREYYRPVDRGFERELAERLKAIRAACAKWLAGGARNAPGKPGRYAFTKLMLGWQLHCHPWGDSATVAQRDASIRD